MIHTNEPLISGMDTLLTFIRRLESANITYTIQSVRDAVMVVVQVPGQHWEVEFFADGHVEVERYLSTGIIEDRDALDDLFATFSD